MWDSPIMTVSILKQAVEILKELHCPFVINQNRYSIFDRTIEQNGLKEMAQEAAQRSDHV